MEVNLQPATSADVPLIHELAHRIWKIHYTPIIGAEQVNYMLGKMYSEECLVQQMNEGQEFFLVNSDQLSIGYVSISLKEQGEYFLNKFYIEVEQQGRGIGKKVFADLLELFPELKMIRLQVNRMNFKTINFYFRLGFQIEFAKDFEIGDGYSMDDYVMIFRK